MIYFALNYDSAENPGVLSSTDPLHLSVYIFASYTISTYDYMSVKKYINNNKNRDNWDK